MKVDYLLCGNPCGLKIVDAADEAADNPINVYDVK